MEANNSQLADVNERLGEAIQNLRAQENLVNEIDCPRWRQPLLMLLSNGLRVYYWLVSQQRKLTRTES
jgi:hypothetical protein